MVTKQRDAIAAQAGAVREPNVPDLLSFEEKAKTGRMIATLLDEMRVVRIGGPPPGDRGPGRGYVGIEMGGPHDRSYVQQVGRDITFVTGMAANVKLFDGDLPPETAEQAEYKRLLREKLLNPVKG